MGSSKISTSLRGVCCCTQKHTSTFGSFNQDGWFVFWSGFPRNFGSL